MNRKVLIGTGLLGTCALGILLIGQGSDPDQATQVPPMAQQASPQTNAQEGNESGIAGPQASLLEQVSKGTDLLGSLSDSELLSKLEIDDRALAWAKVDLQAIRDEIPNNSYWELAAPTQDEALKQHRKEVKEYWRARENKISANLATEEEIREYFARQDKISNDYVEFSTILLNKHGSDLPETDYGMQNLGRKLHLARLQDIPGQLARALENRENFLSRKSEWLADKDAYEAKLRQERDAALKKLGKI
ncbi:MAG: hypothetical protein C9356_14180 [Oleiphilus sp.]|nr:MAG: hypothetical protein C9356_14180 [Oleiphilus sp.]